MSSHDKPSKENSEKEIARHREAASHLESAVKYHFDAAKHYENGDVDRAKECNTKAQACTDKAISELNKKD